MSKPSRHFCITFWKKPIITSEIVRYGIFGEEICPDTKKVHWQSYVEFTKPQRISAIRKHFNGDKEIKAFIRKGTREQARDYCKKDNKYFEYGKWIKGQGHRTDLETIVEEIKNGKKLSDVMIESPKTYCQYRNGLKDIASTVTKSNTKKFRKLEVELITGPTGTGKTRKAMETSEYRIQGTQLAWWQDYDGEKTICIDEYNNDVSITELLNLLDGYQLRLNVKGTHTYANWTKVFITTNLKIDEIHPNAKEAHRKALFRRITTITNLWDNCNEEVQGNTELGPSTRENNLKFDWEE